MKFTLELDTATFPMLSDIGIVLMDLGEAMARNFHKPSDSLTPEGTPFRVQMVDKATGNVDVRAQVIDEAFDKEDHWAELAKSKVAFGDGGRNAVNIMKEPASE